MPDDVTCKECRYCTHTVSDGLHWYECRHYGDVGGDDHCSLGRDIPPEYIDEDESYERKKYETD